jgi:hypothetical protein
MHIKFREGISDRMVEYASQHPEFQQDAESLAGWARETYGVPVERHDPTLPYPGVWHWCVVLYRNVLTWLVAPCFNTWYLV